MRNRTLVVVLFAASACFAQSESHNAKAPDVNSQSAEKFGPATVWRADSSFVNTVQTACGKMPAAAAAQCAVDEMTKAGATPAAIKFTRELDRGTGEVGILQEFKSFGPVGLAWVIYPLRTTIDGLLVLNGEPPFVDPDDIQKLDKTALQNDAIFQEWKKTTPKLDVYPGDRAGGTAQVQFARVWPGKQPGAQRFLFSYPLRDGCATCTSIGFANYWWDFDPEGKFLGTKLLSVTRGVPPIKKHMAPPPTGSAPSTEPGTAAPGSKPASGGTPTNPR